MSGAQRRACLTRLDRARSLIEAGREEGGRRVADRISGYASCPRDVRARALLIAAGGPLGREDMLRQVMERYPSTPAAEDALEFLVERRAERSKQEAIAFLERLRVPPPLQDDRALWLARLNQEAGHRDAALQWYVRLAGMEGSPLQDDGLYQGGLLAYTLGRHDLAEKLLVRLSRMHRTSWLIGYYDSEFADDGLLLLGRVRAAKGDLAGALQAWNMLVERYPSSRLVDDALHEGAQALLRSGRRARACSWLRRLKSLRPESRYATDWQSVCGR